LSLQLVAWCLFWGAALAIVYAYLGFPLLLACRPRRPLAPEPNSVSQRSVTLVIVGHNEADVIDSKIDNALALDYPRQLLEIVVASDGSDDGMDELVEARSASGIKLLSLPRRGKNPALNAAVAATTSEIIVFTDAEAMLDPQSLRYLLAPFDDPEVGGVGGDFRYVDSEKKGEIEGVYWNFDRWIKSLQSQAGSMTSATGQIYALRRALSTPVPRGVTDDFYNSTSAVAAGKRLIFEPRAVASGPITDSKVEFRRKVRISTRGFNSLWHRRSLLNPFAYGFYAWQLFAHKLLRRLLTLPLLVLLVTAPILWFEGWLYQVATVGQLTFHGAALLGALCQATPMARWKILSLPYYYDMVNISAVIGLLQLIRGKSFDVWQPQR
jgi:cellulose synthase/poly-beta-1,6-N-acetylglucosamine synthase-like glycosyltransferase